MRLSPSGPRQCLPPLSTSAPLPRTCGRTDILQRPRSGPRESMSTGQISLPLQREDTPRSVGNPATLTPGPRDEARYYYHREERNIQKCRGRESRTVVAVFEPATSGSPTIEVMSPALWFPFRGLTRLSHPGRTSRRVSAAKSIPDKSLNKTPNPALTPPRGFSSEKI